MARTLSVTTSRILWLMMFALVASLGSLLSFEAARAANTKHWPATEGVVISFFETPNYRYSAGGVTQVCDRVSCNEFFNHWLAVRNSASYAEKYPLNSKVTVHYHPAKPEMAVLETTFDRSILMFIAGMFLFCLLCVIGFYRGWRWRMTGGRTY